jgi:hypothetical protein
MEKGTNLILMIWEDWIISFKAGTDLSVIPLLPSRLFQDSKMKLKYQF